MTPACLHGIVPAGTAFAAGLSPHRLIVAGPVAGIVSDLAAEPATEARTIALVLAHDRLLAGYLARGPVLPVRFGTGFSSETAVAAELAGAAPAAAARLAALADGAEYGLVVEAAPLAPAGAAPSPAAGGRAFLMDRRDRRDDLRRQAAAREAALARLGEAATALARQVAVRPPRAPRVLALALLLDPAAGAALQRQLRLWQGDWPDLPARLDGPFPPYSFCAPQPEAPAHG